MKLKIKSALKGPLYTGDYFLQVADNFVGLDVLSTFSDVKTNNFRRFPSLPVYGMAQPSREVSQSVCLLT